MSAQPESEVLVAAVVVHDTDIGSGTIVVIVHRGNVGEVSADARADGVYLCIGGGIQGTDGKHRAAEFTKQVHDVVFFCVEMNRK